MSIKIVTSDYFFQNCFLVTTVANFQGSLGPNVISIATVLLRYSNHDVDFPHRLCISKICYTQGFILMIGHTVDTDWHYLIMASSKFGLNTWHSFKY